MMKISKPVLTNDFLISPVQFRSLNFVNFKNIKPVYDGNENIILEYEYPSKIEVSTRDWIGIFPRGWSSLQQYVTFEWTSQIITVSNINPNKGNGDTIKKTITFSSKYHTNCVNQNAFYHFVYVGKQIEVLGVSSYFRFDLSCVNDSNLELECLVPVTGKILSASVSDFGTLSMINNQSFTSINSRKLIQTSSIHSLQNLDIDGKFNWSRMNSKDDKKNIYLTTKSPVLLNETGDNLDPYCSHSEPIFPMTLQVTQCKRCQFKRNGECIRSQQVLQSKLKIVMERNKILEERAQKMKKELEKLQSESKSIKMIFYNVNKEKVAYEKFVKDFIKSLEKDSIVRVMYGNTEILVKKVNYVGMEEHPRDKKTSKRERELKAVIGLQEITIRNLINSLQEKAKSVEELNQTVKLVQMFSAETPDDRDLGIDSEESNGSNHSDITSDYKFSLTKPSPPEEVSEGADEVLDSIRRTSEIELKNIGITRSLGNDSASDLGVTNLTVMTYEAENTLSKQPHLVDNVDDCWHFPTNSCECLGQKLHEEKLSLSERNIVSDQSSNISSNVSKQDFDGTTEGEIFSKINLKSNDMEFEKNTDDFDSETNSGEDFFDAYDTLSVKSFSPEPENCEVNDNDEIEEKVKFDVQEKNNNCDIQEKEENFLMTTIVSQETQEEKDSNTKMDIKCYQESNSFGFHASEKFKNLICELTIDFKQKQILSRQSSNSTIFSHERGKANPNFVICRPSESVFSSGNFQIYSLNRERSLITFKKSKKCIEVKISQINQSEKPKGYLQQKIIFEFAGTGSNRNVNDLSIDSSKSSPEPEDMEASDEESSIVPDRRESEDSEISNNILNNSCESFCGEGTSEEDATEKTQEKESKHLQKKRNEGTTEIETFFAQTDSKDATNGDEPENVTSIEDSFAENQNDNMEMELQMKEQKSEVVQQFVKNKCGNETPTEGNNNNFEICQDSLINEKNLQFFNEAWENTGKENNEILKEKPSAILIQSGREKFALIRYQ